MTTQKSSAASFIDQIKSEYSQVVKAEGDALPHAIRCGEFLNLAKENLKVEKGCKWKDWLEANCPEIPQTTASLYMRLAENKKLVAKAKSIREANEIIRKANKRTRTPSPSANQVDSPPANADGHSFEHEVEALAPDEVCKLLVDTWEDDQLRELVKLITEHLQKTKPPLPISNTVANSPPQSAGIRRPV